MPIYTLAELILAFAMGLGCAYLILSRGLAHGQTTGYALARKYFETKLPHLRKRGAQVWIDGQPVDGLKSVWIQNELDNALGEFVESREGEE